MEDIFNWLENEMNKQQLFYFKQTSDNEITSYFKNDDSAFAAFEIDKIKKAMNYW